MEPIETVELEGPAGRVVVNKSDLASWIERGYSEVKAEPEPAPEPAPKTSKKG